MMKNFLIANMPPAIVFSAYRTISISIAKLIRLPNFEHKTEEIQIVSGNMRVETSSN
jgi:hypothetical protein